MNLLVARIVAAHTEVHPIGEDSCRGRTTRPEIGTAETPLQTPGAPAEAPILITSLQFRRFDEPRHPHLRGADSRAGVTAAVVHSPRIVYGEAR